MKNYDHSVKIIQNSNWPYIPGQTYGILIIVVWDQGKLMCY